MECPAATALQRKKFVLADIQKGARFKDYEFALQWLKNSGLVYPVYRIKKPHLPLSGYQENIFKLYCLDVGLLGTKSQPAPTTLLEPTRLFPEFKGALTEQYVLQQLQASQPTPIFYWATEKGTAGVDFVLQCGQDVILIEVKAEENLRAKSLKSYVEQYQPDLAMQACFDVGLSGGRLAGECAVVWFVQQ